MSDEESLVENSADERQVKRAKKRERALEDDFKKDLMIVLGTQSGRNVFYELLEYCCVWHSCYSPEVTLMAHNTGRQDAGHWILSKIGMADPALIGKMHEEYAYRQKENSKK